jgi:hypothetical protein
MVLWLVIWILSISLRIMVTCQNWILDFFFKLQLWTLKTTLTTLGVNTSLDKSCKSSLLPKVIVQFSPHCIDFSCDEIMWCACLSLVSMNMFALFNTCGSNCTYALMMYIIYVH